MKWILSIVATIALACQATAQEAFLKGANVVRWSSGKYDYIAIADNQIVGEETWLLTVHPDGTRTLRATNSYAHFFEAHGQVVMRVDERFRPLEAYVNYWKDGSWLGSGLVSVSGNTLQGTINRPGGQLLQTLKVPQQFSFIPHPISSDSWPAWYYDKQKGGAQEITVYEFDDVGKNGGVMGSLATHTITLVGQEEVRTPAGKFDSDHFVFGDGEAHMYFFGPDRMLAKMSWEAANLEFVLSEYRSGP